MQSIKAPRDAPLNRTTTAQDNRYAPERYAPDILDPADRCMGFYRLTAARRYAEIRPDAGVIRSQVLPGFQ